MPTFCVEKRLVVQRKFDMDFMHSKINGEGKEWGQGIFG
jgi:hypothetical protein